jgi:hypothetical protein
MLVGTRLSPCTRGMETERSRRDNVGLDGGVRTAGQWSPSRLSWGGRRRDRVSHGTFDEGSIGTIAQPQRLRRGGEREPLKSQARLGRIIHTQGRPVPWAGLHRARCRVR